MRASSASDRAPGPETSHLVSPETRKLLKATFPDACFQSSFAPISLAGNVSQYVTVVSRSAFGSCFDGMTSFPRTSKNLNWRPLVLELPWRRDC